MNPNKCDHKFWCKACNKCHNCCCSRCGEKKYLICECEKTESSKTYYRFCPSCCNELCTHLKDVVIKNQHIRFDSTQNDITIKNQHNRFE